MPNSTNKRGRPALPTTEIIKEYLSKFPNAPSKTLSTKIYKENLKYFTSSDKVYDSVRYYRGQAGVSKRKALSQKTYLQPLKIHVMTNYETMPPSLTEKRGTFTFPTACKKLGVIGDIHLPYHDEDAVETACDKMEAENIDSLLINGDLLDFYQLSFHEKDPRKVHFKEEIEAGRQFLAYLRSRFPGIPIYYIPGNHENRFERYLRLKASELLDVDEFRLDVLLRVAESRVEYIPFRTKLVFGDFLIEHGDKIPGAGGVVPARTAIMRLKTNCIINHFHKTSQSSQRVYGAGDSVSIRGYSLGCLCELAPDYMEINEWNHGFAIMTKLDNMVSVSNYKIENNTVL
jgi:predicted phosphodiesterase